jgi:hypothetical protein
MAKIKVKVGRELSDDVYRAFVVISDRVVNFGNAKSVDIFVETGVTYYLSIIVYGPRGAKGTVTVKRGDKDVIPPLVCTIANDLGVDHSADQFTP